MSCDLAFWALARAFQTLVFIIAGQFPRALALRNRATAGVT